MQPFTAGESQETSGLFLRAEGLMKVRSLGSIICFGYWVLGRAVLSSISVRLKK